MSNPYSNINFDVFSQVAEEKLTKGEHNKIMKDFYQKADCYNKKRTQRRSMAAIASCLILCLAISPIGNATWAAVKQALMGIGQYLGMSRQDDYVTVVDQTQKKNGITVTLNDAIGSDNELRVSVTVVKDDGRVLGGSKVNIGHYAINGMDWNNGLKTTGVGPFGSKRTKDGGIYFMGASYYDFEMPVNPTIDMDIEAGGEKFSFSFILKNEQLKKATRTADINKTILYKGKRLVLKQLIVSPIDQKITFDNPDNLDPWKDPFVYLYGVDNTGEAVTFDLNPFEMSFCGYRENKDESTYQINPDVTAFTLTAYDLNQADLKDLWNPENAISEEFTVKIE